MLGNRVAYGKPVTSGHLTTISPPNLAGDTEFVCRSATSQNATPRTLHLWGVAGHGSTKCVFTISGGSYRKVPRGKS